jgi:small subunit ribosomal protein S16
MRLGKMRSPHYRVVVADSRTKRDGRVIETIGKYHPKEDPSFIEIDSARAIHWLSVGAQPTEAVAALLKVTGAWQEFKGEPAPPPMLVKAPKADKKSVFEAAHHAGAEAAVAEEKAPKAKKAPKAEEPASDAATEAPAADTDAPAADAATDAPAADAAEAPAAETPAEATEVPEPEKTTVSEDTAPSPESAQVPVTENGE